MTQKKILAVYLITKFCDPDNLKYFIDHYKKHKPGCKHNLLICLKQIDPKKKLEFEMVLKRKKIKCNIFYDDHHKNDYDFGSYYRIAKKFKKYIILFMNVHSRPIKKNWLKKLIDNYSSKTFIGVAGSYSSYATNSFLRNYQDNYFAYIYKIIRNNILFFRFPNPHIRSSCFMLFSSDFIEFIKSSKIIFNKKFDTWLAESGKNGMSNYFKKKGFKLLIINSEGKSFSEKDWKISKTFCIENQDYLLISDKHSRAYQESDKNQKRQIIKRVWGPNTKN